MAVTGGASPDLRVDLRDDWRGLLERRPALAQSLAAYSPVFDRWALSAPLAAPLDWDAHRCASAWERGAPLLADAIPRLSPGEVEALLGPTMEWLGDLGALDGPALQRFAEAWDQIGRAH